jgi:hypothetical protein
VPFLDSVREVGEDTSAQPRECPNQQRGAGDSIGVEVAENSDHLSRIESVRQTFDGRNNVREQARIVAQA